MSRPELRAAVRNLPGYVPGRRSLSADVAALASNESHFDPLPSVRERILAGALRVHRYPDMAATALRERIAGHCGVAGPGGTDSGGADQVVVGPGSVGVLQQLLNAVIEPGDEVVHAWRSFEAYPILVAIAGGTSVPVPLTADEHHDLPAMLAAIGPATRVVLLCSPNNPTGVPLSHNELTGFLDAVPPHVLVILDEAYVEFVTGTDPVDGLAAYHRYPNLCVLRTFSKAYGLAGLRVGYAIAHPELAEGARRTALPFGVTALAQEAAIASLDAVDEIAQRVAAVVGERARLTAGLRASGWWVPDSAANFVWLRMDDENSRRTVESLAAADILVRAYPGDGVRITVADAIATDRVLAALPAPHTLPAPTAA
ncbi:histidinol-phosphate transaminase [Kineosporia sp. J2-2]|uniref:Aromatic amino acid aminotransferase n=1 Tax=Kineosporia corallincola TaxID=2835133 RepID=A0ABS5TLY0_9ACTN|nr:histidinol-phosphate transaminase [Kineosporia corallincola]MBT0772015.1 histidinol-phosphate transaminase [Kineosporia corallincola]